MPVVVADRSRRWLTTVALITPHNAEQRIERLTRQIEELAPEWSMAPVATAIQAMRGVALINAVTVVAEVGDFARFGNPRQLMAYLGLMPSRALERRGCGTAALPRPVMLMPGGR